MGSRAVAVSIASVIAAAALGDARPAFSKTAAGEIRMRCPCAGPDTRMFWNGRAERRACVERAIAQLATLGSWPAELLERTRMGEQKSGCGVRRLRCGGTSNRRCARGWLCEVVDPACRPEGAPGICVPRRHYRPRECRDNPYPVCGCDRTTYATECSLRAAGVPLVHTGSCEHSCGGPDHVVCPAGQICYGTYGCDGADAWGACGVADDPTCAPGATPIAACGCDGTTYSSPCDLVGAGVALRHTGSCLTE